MPETLTHATPQRCANAAPVHVVVGGHPWYVPCPIFPSAGGASFSVVGAEQPFADLSALTGRPQWLQAPRFANYSARHPHETELSALLRRATVEQRTDEWMAALCFAGVPCAALAPSPSSVGG